MESRWDEQAAAARPELEGLVYASRLVGAEPSLALFGGGNTSAKLWETDFRERTVEVLRIKGSGFDLRMVEPRHFAGVRLDDVRPLAQREAMGDEEMVAYLAHTLMEPSSPRPSIETLLHAFLPARFVIHTHADAILGLANTPSGERWVREALGPQALWIPYQRPGFALSKQVALAVRDHPDATCVVLAKHGLVTWGDTARQAYERTIELVTRAEQFIEARRAARGAAPEPADEPAGPDAAARRRVYARIAPLIRGLAGRTSPWGEVRPASQTLEVPPAGRVILRFDDAPDVRSFAADPRAARLSQIGPATPDHLVHIRRTPLYVPVALARSGMQETEEALVAAIEAALPAAWEQWVRDYVAYVRAGPTERTPAPPPEEVDPRPRVILLPGLGMVTLGRDAAQAATAAELYHHALATIRAAEAVEAYASLSAQECFDVEYWPLERYRLTLAPPEAELARRIILVTGAAGGIGKAIAERLCRDGAHVIVCDVNGEGARLTAGELCRRYGEGCAVAVPADVASEAAVQALYQAAVVAYGGLDVLVSNAGIAPFAPLDQTSLSDWQRSLDVNATGHFLVTREALRLFRRQGLGGNIIFIATKNVMAPGKEFGAYSAAKSAQAQLARVAALEGGELGVRVNMINPDAVFRDSHLWSEELRQARARAHGVAVEELGDFYRRRCLLGLPIYPEDVAEAAWWLATDRSRKTTGCAITVDGGVPAAFPR